MKQPNRPSIHRPLSSVKGPWSVVRGPWSVVSGLPSSRAFSLIEMIGVLAIIAALAAMLLPRMIKRIDIATRNREAANLEAVRDALQLDVVRNLTVPDSSGWAQAAARWSSFSAARLPINARRYNRLYVSDPLLTNLTLPYTQSPSGTGRPNNLRAMVITTLGGPPLNIPSLSTGQFDELWETRDGSPPPSSVWAGPADDFLVQRINYAPLFHRLLLVNRDSVPAHFNINGSANIPVNNTVPNIGVSAYYIDGSVVGLCDASGYTKTLYSITRDIGFVFEAGAWRAEIMGMNTSNSQAGDFAAQAAAFLGAQWNPDAFQGADQQGVLTAMYSLMYTYTLWANQCPHFPYHGATAVQVPEYLMLQRIGDPNQRLQEFSERLLRDR